MTERVKSLIEFLKFNKDSLWYACSSLGFNEEDLSFNELDALYSEIFQCEYCGRWEPADEQFYDFEYGSICGSCVEELDEDI